jgi:hypothetical protein
MKKQNRVARKGDAAPCGAQSRKPVAARRAIGEELAYSETAPGEEQYLLRSGKIYVLVTEWMEFYGQGEWRRFSDWSTIASKDIPLSKHRKSMVSRPITREDAIEWLRKNLAGNLVPAEFCGEFLPANCIPMPAPVDYREKLLALLGLDSEARKVEINTAMAAYT